MAKYLQAHLNGNYWNYSAFDFYKYFPPKNLKNPVFKSTFFLYSLHAEFYTSENIINIET